MLAPKRVKHRKVHRGRMKGKATGHTEIQYGDYAIVALEPGWITNRQIEASRVAMTRHIKRGGKVWITIFPDKPVTKKPAETRMGSGKGNPEGWVAVVKPGRVMFELSGVNEPLASKAVELRELPDDDLYVRIESAKEELFNLRFQLATGQLDNTARLKELRHDVARLATVLRERELELDRIEAAQAREDVAEEDVE